MIARIYTAAAALVLVAICVAGTLAILTPDEPLLEPVIGAR